MTHVEHQLVAGNNVITCTGCPLQVPRPPDMPDYSRAAMARWTPDERSPR